MSTYIFDFRATSGFVTDPAGGSPVLAESYPHTYSNGLVAGWTTNISGQSRDRDNTVNAQLAGINFNTNTASPPQVTFQVDLPVSGVWTVRLALGDAGGPQAYQYLQIKDGSTSRLILDESTGTNGLEFYDATGVKRTSAADWVTNNASNALTFSTTTLNMAIGEPSGTKGGSSTIATLSLTAPAGASSWGADLSDQLNRIVVGAP